MKDNQCELAQCGSCKNFRIAKWGSMCLQYMQLGFGSAYYYSPNPLDNFKSRCDFFEPILPEERPQVEEVADEKKSIFAIMQNAFDQIPHSPYPANFKWLLGEKIVQILKSHFNIGADETDVITTFMGYPVEVVDSPYQMLLVSANKETGLEGRE